jgi:hypothetical protein
VSEVKYADTGELLYTAPTTQAVGMALRLDLEVVTVFPPPLGRSRKRTSPAPTGASTAIQYCAPDVTLTAGSATVFQVPDTGLSSVALESSAPGCPAASAYKPTITRVAELVASMKRLSELAVPEAAASIKNASPMPGVLLSM